MNSSHAIDLVNDQANPRLAAPPSPRLRAAVAMGLGVGVLLIAGCGALPDRPARAVLYDFGPGLVAGNPAVSPTAAGAPVAMASTLALAEVEASARLEGTQVLYRVQSERAVMLCRAVCTQIAIEIDEPVQVPASERLVGRAVP